MRLGIQDGRLEIRLNPLETLVSFRRLLSIPLDKIMEVSTERPKLDWRQIRSPGTHIPFVIKAGTYYGGGGRDFWHATIGRPVLMVAVRDWDCDRIVVSIGNNQEWAERIRKAINGQMTDDSLPPQRN